MRTASGLLNQRIEIYSDQDYPDGSGGMTPNTVAYWITSANVKPISWRRDLSQGQEILKPAFTFEISDRNDKTVRANMLIKYRGAWFTITNVVPDYVYVQKLIITAITSDVIVRDVPSDILIEYGWSDVDYRGNESDFPFQLEMIETTGLESLTVPFPLIASGSYLAFRIPTGQTMFNHYYIDETNEGDIPSFRWYDVVESGGYDYYLTRSPIILDQTINNIIFTRNGL
jgi:SPP1 family predicted phage head-tail adaptor